MKFTDEIHVDVRGRSGRASLFVDPGAEYLDDHFPGAPMLPGLVMLEAAVRAAAAVWRSREDVPAGASMLDRVDRLQIVRPIVPGQTLVVRTEILEPAADRDTQAFKAAAEAAGQIVMRARFRLRRLDGVRAGISADREAESAALRSIRR